MPRFWGFGGAFFSLFFLLRVFFFRIFVSGFQVVNMVASLFPSSAAVVEAFGFAALRGRFAVVVLDISPAPGFSVAERVAAACPRFASLLCGWLGCSWWVAWGVAVRCASSFGVSVASGGVASGGAQLSLF